MGFRKLSGRDALRMIAGATVVVLVFAFVYPFTGGFVIPGPGENAYDSSSLFEGPAYFATVFAHSLYISIKNFTLVGTSEYQLLGFGRVISGIESLLGMGFIAYFAASLSAEE